MKIIEEAITPNGVEIRLEDWSDNNTAKYPDLYGLDIGAYPIAQRTRGYWIRGGEKFRLTISQNNYMGYTNEDVKADFEALKSGEKTLEDLASHFWYGQRDAYTLGMDVPKPENY